MDKYVPRRLLFAASVLFTVTTACVETHVSEHNKPTPTNPSVELDPTYEMCILPTPGPEDLTGADAVNAYIAGTPMPPDVLATGNSNKLEDINISPESLIKREANVSSDYQVVLVPVGYDDTIVDFRMSQLADNLSLVFNGVNINFSYLNTSVPIQINHISRLLRFESQAEADSIFGKIDNVHNVDSVVFVVNSDMYGGSGGTTAIATGENEASLYLISHELSHGIHLDDGYQRYYREGNIPNGEFFFDAEELRVKDPIIDRAYSNLLTQPPIVKVGVCNGKPVWSFYGVKNIMNGYWSDDDIRKSIQEGGSMFTPLQIETMNEYIKTIR